MKKVLLILCLLFIVSCSTDSVEDDTCTCTQTRIVYNADGVITNQTQDVFNDSCDRDGEFTEASGNNGSIITTALDCN